MAKNVVLIGTLDTKGEEIEYLKGLVNAHGLKVTIIDVGFGGKPLTEADVPREDVAKAAGLNMDDIAAQLRLGIGEEKIVELIAKGASIILGNLHAAGRVQGVVGIGGSLGSFIAATAMRKLPIGVPKILVSTQASTLRSLHYINSTDIILMNSVADLAGLNWVTRGVLKNAALAVVGMVAGSSPRQERSTTLIGATNIGILPCIMRAGEILEERGFELISFHATGSGGRAFEKFISENFFAGVLDLSTHEVANEVFNGVHKAGPRRLRTAGEKGIPQVVSVGCLNFIVFYNLKSIPSKYKGRYIWYHNPLAYAVELSPSELEVLGKVLADRLNKAKGPTALLIPLRGWYGSGKESVSRPSPEGCNAFIKGFKILAKTSILIKEIDAHINDSKFAEIAVSTLMDMFNKSQ